MAREDRHCCSFSLRNTKMGIWRDIGTVQQRSFTFFFHKTSKRVIRDSQSIVVVDGHEL